MVHTCGQILVKCWNKQRDVKVSTQRDLSSSGSVNDDAVTILLSQPLQHSLPIYHFAPTLDFFLFDHLIETQISFRFSEKNPQILSHSLRCFASSSVGTPKQSSETKPFSVLFVCLGNICRGPAAEGVFRDIVKKRGLNSKFNIASAGTIDYHQGNMADPRMTSAAKRRGIEITSLSRPIKASDFSEFDLILAMDKQNKEDNIEGL